MPLELFWFIDPESFPVRYIKGAHTQRRHLLAFHMKSSSGVMTQYYAYDNSFFCSFCFPWSGCLGSLPWSRWSFWNNPAFHLYLFIYFESISLCAPANPQPYLVFFLWCNSKRSRSAVFSLRGGENHHVMFLLSFEYLYVTLATENLWLKVLERIILFKDDTLHPLL